MSVSRLCIGRPFLLSDVGLCLSEMAGSIFGALPVAIAVFPQEMKISTSSLEPEFQGLKDSSGKPIEYVLCNKGL